jgi:hypothetical protein
MTDDHATILAVHESADGYWYIGAGRSIAEGPYRYPQQLLSVASDLLAGAARWRIDVFDAAGNQIITYNSDQLTASDLGSMHRQREWSRMQVSAPADRAQADQAHAG